MITSILFDLDDTLYDQLQPFIKAFQLTFPSVKNINAEKLFKIFRQKSDEVFPSYQAHFLSQELMWEYRMSATMQAIGVSNYNYQQIMAFEKAYNFNLNHIKPYSEIISLIKYLLKQNYYLAIISNGDYQHQIKKITALKIDQYIPLNKIFISDCLGVAKPNPEIFLQVASRQNLLPPKMLYIGDNYINDIVAAQQAGLKTAWFNHRHVHLSSRKVLPNLEISSPSALINIVDFLKKN